MKYKHFNKDFFKPEEEVYCSLGEGLVRFLILFLALAFLNPFSLLLIVTSF